MWIFVVLLRLDVAVRIMLSMVPLEFKLCSEFSVHPSHISNTDSRAVGRNGLRPSDLVKHLHSLKSKN